LSEITIKRNNFVLTKFMSRLMKQFLQIAHYAVNGLLIKVTID